MIELQEYSGTFAIGSFVAIVLCWIGFSTFFAPLFFHLKVKVNSIPSAALALMTIVIASGLFGLGLLAEDLSNKFVDSDEQKTGLCWIPRLSCFDLPTEKELRRETLYGTECCEYSSVLVGLAERGMLSRYGRKSDRDRLIEFEKQILNGVKKEKSLNCSDVFESLPDRIYYIAKNTVSARHWDKLHPIQLRIDFARSVAISAIFLLGVAVLVYLVHLLFIGIILSRRKTIPNWIKVSTPRLHQLFAMRNLSRQKGGTFAFIFGHHFAFCIVLIMVYFAGRIAYQAEEIEFNKQAYGYFSTLSDPDLPVYSQQETKRTSRKIGVSGLVAFCPNSYLAVHDSKEGSHQPRLSLIRIDKDKTNINCIPIDWKSHGPIAKDLEAICRSPSANRFLIFESGYWRKESNDPFEGGRIFEIELSEFNHQWQAKVTRSYQLPEKFRSLDSSIEIEGAEYVERSSGNFLVIALRGNKNVPTEIIKAVLNDDSSMLKIVESRKLELQDDRIQTNRHCSSLMLDSHQNLWGTATFDAGNNRGPFDSALYKIGPVNQLFGSKRTIHPKLDIQHFRGLKIEGIALSETSNKQFVFGTDDEDYGGIWRISNIPYSTVMTEKKPLDLIVWIRQQKQLYSRIYRWFLRLLH